MPLMPEMPLNKSDPYLKTLNAGHVELYPDFEQSKEMMDNVERSLKPG
jgi:hypothetical protein